MIEGKNIIMKVNNVFLVYINSAIVLSVALLSYILDFQISDMFQQIGISIGHGINFIYAVYCIFFLFILSALSNVLSFIRKKRAMRFMLVIFLFIHMAWFVLYITYLVKQ